MWRANIILATADGCGTAEIMRRSGKSKPVVWRWQARFMAEGVAGLRRDKTRKPREAPLPATTVQRVVDLALGPPPGEVTHWTGRMLAKTVGIDAQVPRRKKIHATVDNYATHKHPVEGFFAQLTSRRLKRGVFTSVADLKAAINRFVEETNSHPKPFVWTADPKRVLAAVKRGKQALDSLH